MLLILMFKVVGTYGDKSSRFERVLFPVAKDKADAEKIISKVATILPGSLGDIETDENLSDTADFLFEVHSGETGKHQYRWLGTRKR